MRILVFQHLDVEHPGIFRNFWSAAGHDVHYVHLDQGNPIPDLAAFEALVVLGGPMDVWDLEQCPWLKAEMDAIRHWVRDLGRPYLGICLGHQLLAQALGGEVGLMDRPEVGLAEVSLTEAGQNDLLFKGFSESFEVFQWHGAAVQRLPEGAVVLAGNAACPVQAMRVNTQAWGIQFHVEMTDQTVAEWSAIPEYAASLQKALGSERAAGLEGALAPYLPVFNTMAQTMNSNVFGKADCDG